MPKPKKTKTLEPRAPLPSLRWWRNARKLSVAEVHAALAAREHFMSEQAVYHWERGSRCSLVHARALAEILAVSVEALRAAPPEVRA